MYKHTEDKLNLILIKVYCLYNLVQGLWCRAAQRGRHNTGEFRGRARLTTAEI